MSYQAHGWFGTSGSETSLLTPVKELHEEREKWSISQLSMLKPDDAYAILPEAKAAKDVYDVTDVDIEALVARLARQDSDNPLQSKAASELNAAAQSMGKWKVDRTSTPSRKACAGLQRFLSSIADFLKAFSGIVEIIKSADQTFGGLAYGTITTLLAVAVQKQAREEALIDAFEELAHAFPRLETLQQLRKTYHLKALIAEIFELTIVFCRESIDYFAERMHRLKKALSPLKLRTLSRLRIKLSEVQKECAIVALTELAEARLQLREMQEQLRRMEDTGDDTNNRMRQSHAWIKSRATQQYLRELKKTLGLDQLEDRSANIVARYKTRLGTEFAGHRKKYKSAQKLSAKMLNNDAVFSSWKNSPSSTGLVLRGRNWLQTSSVELNWLSSASVLVVESSTPPTCLLSYFCCIDYTTNRSKQETFDNVIRSLIYQLVEQHSELVQPSMTEVVRRVESQEWETSDAKIEYFASLLGLLPAGSEVVVVIDRLDQCRWTEESASGEGTLVCAVGSLRDLVVHEDLKHICLKMLLVMDQGRTRNVARTFDWTKGRGLEWKTWEQEAEE